jgi:MFS family permease
MFRSPPGPRLVLALVCLPVFIGALDLTIVSAVLPAVIADLNIPLQTGLDEAAWVVSGYLLAYAVSMTFMGRVSDVWGRRRVYLVCLAVFFFGSWLAAASGGAPAELVYRVMRWVSGARPERSLMALYALITGRVTQAFGAGALVPVSMALVADLFPPQQRAVPLGLIGAVDTAGWVLGHLYGGLMVQFLPWPWLFWINLPISVLMFGLTAWALRGLPAPGLRPRMDWLGAALLALALVGLNIGLGAEEPVMTEAAAQPAIATANNALFAFGIGLLCFLLFLLLERRAAQPLLNLRVFAERNVAAGSLVNLLAGFCLMVGLVSVPLFVNVVGAQDSQQGALVSGYLLSAFTVPLAFAALPGGWLTGRLGYRWTAVLGLLIALGGLGLMTQWQPEMARQAVALFGGAGNSSALRGAAQMGTGLLLTGVGLGLTIAPIGTAVINGVSDSERGMASALVIILRLIGMNVSVSTLTTYGLRRFTELNRVLLADVPLTDFARISEATSHAAARVAAEMALSGAAVCMAAVGVSLWLRRRDRAT